MGNGMLFLRDERNGDRFTENAPRIGSFRLILCRIIWVGLERI